MKVKSFMAMLLAAASAVCFTACDDDDDDNSVENSTAVSGTYGDYSLANAKYFSNMYTKESGSAVTVVKVAENTVNVTFESATWGTWSIAEATVSKSGDVYTIEGTGTVEMASHGSEAKSYDATLVATVNGASTVFNFTAEAVMGGTTVSVYNSTEPVAYLAAGKYSGASTVAVGANSYDAKEGTLVVAYQAADAVSLTLPAYAMSETMALPALTVSGVSVVASEDGTYAISLDKYEGTVTVDEAEKSYTISDLEGAISKDGATKVTYTLIYGAMPMGMNFTFTESAE